jgi:O-antigen/teichoic acid export membrane protein
MVIVSLVASAYQIGLFGLTFRISEILLGVPILVAGTVLPFLVESFGRSVNRFRLDLGVAVHTAVIGGAGLSLVVAVGAPTIVLLLGGDAFEGAIGVLRIQSVSLVLVAAGAALGVGMIAVRANRWVLAAASIGLLVSIAVTTPLALIFGALGAAIGVTVAEAALLVGMYLGLRHMGVLPVFSLVRAGAALAIVAALTSAILIPHVPNALVTVAAAAIYAGLVWKLRLLPWQVQQEVQRTVLGLFSR